MYERQGHHVAREKVKPDECGYISDSAGQLPAVCSLPAEVHKDWEETALLKTMQIAE